MDNIDTSCKICIFADYEDKTQVGCKVNMLPKFKNKLVQIDECYDEEKKFFVIRKRQCMAKRNDGWIYAGLPIEDQQEELTIELDVAFHAIIIGSPYPDDTLYSIRDLKRQKYLPKLLTVINIHQNPPLRLTAELKDSEFYKWELDNVVDDSKDIDALIHKNVKKYNLPFHAIFESGKDIKPNYLSSINDHIKDLNQFGCIWGESGRHGMVVPLLVHNSWWYTGKGEDLVKELEDLGCQIGQKLVTTI